MSIGENIKKARKQAGLTQKELGQRLGVKQQTIAMYENNQTNIKYTTAEKIAKALNVPIESIYTIAISDNMSFVFDDLVMTEILSDDEVCIILDYRDLNSEGKQEASKRVEELTYIPKYKKDPD